MTDLMKSPMEISDVELRSLTRDLDEMHRSTRPRYLSALDDVAEAIRQQLSGLERARQLAASRRNFMRGGIVSAGVLGGGLIAACGSSSSSSSSSGGQASSSGSSSASPDLQVARLAASLEVLAVSTYQTALQAAGQGKFGTVPPAFGVFAQTAMMQHQDHENAWNSTIQKAGQQPQTAPDPKYKGVVDQAVPTLKTIPDVAKLALQLETIALQTYVKGATLVTDKANRLVSLTIAPVEAQHAAILNFVLGQYPVPDTDIGTDMAASPSDLGSSGG